MIQNWRGDEKVAQYLLDGEDPWVRFHHLQQLSKIREIIEEVAEAMRMKIKIFEVQLRRRRIRHLRSSDLKHTHDTLSKSHIVTMPFPTLNQVKDMQNYLSHDPVRRLVVLYEEEGRVDDLVEDFRRHTFNVFTPTEEGFESEQRSQVYIAHLKNEDQMSAAFMSALDFNGMQMS